MRDLSIIEHVSGHLQNMRDNNDPGCELEGLLPLVVSFRNKKNPTCQDIVSAEHVCANIIDYLYTEYPTQLADPEREALALDMASECSKVTELMKNHSFDANIIDEARVMLLEEHQRLFPGREIEDDLVLFLAYVPELQDIYRILHNASAASFRKEAGENLHVAARWVYNMLASEHSGSIGNQSEYSEAVPYPTDATALELMFSPTFNDMSLLEVHHMIEALA